ncbi:MAG: maleylpyruvate isomerase N-terminal domain-containing protein [Actinobacteria bacterium]|nr:maleylpyruvate isomerase N-terminal domain-containing protein [Actinomycetota bacterium]
MPAEVWAEVIADLVDELDALLGAVPEGGWESPAASVDWTCWRTAEHIAGDFAHYAAQIIGQPQDHYVKFSFDTSRASTPDELCEVVRVAGGMLAAAVRTGSPDGLGWHPHGYFTPAGFASIGAAEGLVHGHDIAAGLSLAWSPNPQMCEQVLSTVFPDAERGAGATALTTLLNQTGRDERPQGKPSRKWTYSAAAARPLIVNA